MVVSNKPVQYFTDDRDGNHKQGIVTIDVLSFNRDIKKKEYHINVVDYVEGAAIKNKVLVKSYAEIDGIRTMLLNSGKDYSSFQGSDLEDELLGDAVLMLVKSDRHYHSQPEDWIKCPPLSAEEPGV